jgi:exodeoxyribonuclease VII small subunit
MPKQTFENAMKRLERIVEELEKGELGLEEALKKFQEGIKLSRICTAKLDETEKAVSLLLENESGVVQEKPILTDRFIPEDDDKAGK